MKDGVIIAKNEKPLKVSTYLFTKKNYTDFRLIFSAKLVTSNTAPHNTTVSALRTDASSSTIKTSFILPLNLHA